MMPLLLIPLIGLAIDGTRLYIVQSKMQAAVDGAALGAGRLLGVPGVNTTEIAGEFLNVNFPNGYWNTGPVQKNITYTNVQGVQTISVSAKTSLPLTFARMLGPATTGSTVVVSSQAVRKITRVMMVLDRSGSMAGAPFTAMKAGAQWFAAQFTPGYDEVGLVVFSGSGLVAYPETHPWVNDPFGAGGPDKNFSINPGATPPTGPIFDQLTAMAVDGGTNTPEALSQAYVEMQKAHNRDLAAQGYDNVFNAIVLFTDGVPDAISAYINDPTPTRNSLKPFGINVNTQTKCTNDPAVAATPSTQMRGYIVAGGSPKPPGGGTGWSGSYGLLRLASLDSKNSLTWWLNSTGADDYTAGDPSTSIVNCANLTQGLNSQTSTSDLAKIPDFDLYGNPTNSQAFKNSVLYDGTNTWTPNSGINYNNLTPTDPNIIAAAAWNTTDAMGKTIRTQVAQNQIQIFTIGYSGNGGTDTGLLNRLSNTPLSTSYVAAEPSGRFYLVNNTAQLLPAFDAIASSILRLAY
jgi:hypothetical protein